MTPQSIWSKLDRFPPVLVRLLARNPDGSAMTDGEIAGKTPHSPELVRYVSYLPNWDDVAVGTMRDFTVACGVDFASREQMRRVARYLNTRPKFLHLRRSPDFPEYRRMLKIYYDSQTK